MPSVPLDEQHPIDMNIGDAVLCEMNDEEYFAELSIELVEGGIKVVLASDLRSMIVPDDDLYQAVGQLANAHERSGSGLIKAIYEFQKNSNGEWDMVGRFSYNKA
ncbi:hypothetical protein ACL02S_05670 [Nocardia sp. 004]|uniref:hypothetical protein n=1 Tax=Nocardia sp. 004 TaxID=3385978 RepID=UPI0039A32078